MRNQRSSGKIFKFLLVISTIVFITFFIFSQSAKEEESESKLVSPLSSIASIIGAPFKNDALEKIIGESLTGTKGTYAVAIKNLKTGESYVQNEHTIFETASLYKIWIMAVVLDQIQEERLKEDEVLSEEIKVLNDTFRISSESAELTEGSISLTVNQALQQMITISHNYASLLLTKKVGLASVKTFLEEQGFAESTVGTDGGPPTSTSSDIALFFEKLYKGELTSPQNTVKMLDLLKRQKLNNKLPKYLPAETIIAHKTGELGLFTHDGGIVYGLKGDYIIVVLSKSSSPVAAEERIADVSRKVYDYFEN